MSELINKTYKQLLIGGIFSIVMFFAAFFSYYIVRKGSGNWLDFDMPIWFSYSTFLVLLSTICLFIAKLRLKKNINPIYWVITALFLGLFFMYSQIMGWKSLVNFGIYFTGEGSNASGSLLYVLSAAHLAHVLAGIIALAFTIFKLMKKNKRTSNFIGLELSFIFWHFLTLLWIFIYVFIRYNDIFIKIN